MNLLTLGRLRPPALARPEPPRLAGPAKAEEGRDSKNRGPRGTLPSRWRPRKRSALPRGPPLSSSDDPEIQFEYILYKCFSSLTCSSWTFFGSPPSFWPIPPSTLFSTSPTDEDAKCLSKARALHEKTVKQCPQPFRKKITKNLTPTPVSFSRMRRGRLGCLPRPPFASLHLHLHLHCWWRPLASSFLALRRRRRRRGEGERVHSQGTQSPPRPQRRLQFGAVAMNSLQFGGNSTRLPPAAKG